MTKSEKDGVFETPEQVNAGNGFPSSSEANAKQATSAAGGPNGSPAAGGEPDKTAVEPNESSRASQDPVSGESADELVKKANAEAQEWKDKYLRLHAEWDTYRRRTAEQRAEERAHATEKMVEQLLPVIDDLERSIEYAEKNGEAGLLSGVQAVKNKFVCTLEKEGVKVLDPKNEAFNALECQAVSTLENKEVPDETVADVYQKGYKMGKKVIRPAMVTVATGGPKRETPEENSEKK